MPEVVYGEELFIISYHWTTFVTFELETNIHSG